MFHAGPHADYHRPSDTVEKIDPNGLEKIVRFVFRVAAELADGTGPTCDSSLSADRTPKLIFPPMLHGSFFNPLARRSSAIRSSRWQPTAATQGY
jgi:hypothetical protein